MIADLADFAVAFTVPPLILWPLSLLGHGALRPGTGTWFLLWAVAAVAGALLADVMAFLWWAGTAGGIASALVALYLWHRTRAVAS